MKRYLLLAALIAAAPAMAETEIEVQPGLWSYNVSALLGGLPLKQAGQECVSEAQSRRSLDQTAAALGDGCAIADADQIAGGYTFTLSCAGTYRGQVDGKIVTDDDSAALSASGWLDQQGTRVPVSIEGSAEMLSETCG